MASVDLQEKANFSRVSELLVDKGTQALRNTFDSIHPPANLPAVLNANRKSLLRLKFRVISNSQWDLLFPPSGNPPDSQTFDVTLLTVLFRNICGLPPTGWGVMPPDTDRSMQANIVRLKFFRNEVYAHAMSTQMDNATFKYLWQKISQALVELNIPQNDIDDLKTGPREWLLTCDEESMDQESPESWKWEESSVIHKKRFIKLLEYGQEHPEEIKDINGVRVCCSDKFRIGRGSDATRVYIGLGKDGYERAVKRLPRDDCACLAEHEKKVLNELNTTESNYVVKYWFLDDKSDKDWLFIIMDLCEETLKQFVERSSLDDLATNAQTIIRQVLTGLADLHCDPKPILHRDLTPSNILRNVNDKWLLADFGISLILTQEVSTFRSKERGTKHWKAVESCSTNDMSDDDEVRYKKKSDIQVAGMVAFYIVTKGQHPFGEEPDRHRNLLDGNPVYLDKLQDPAAKDLISWMLSHDPKDRPSAEEALKHPYLQPKKQQFEMLCKVGNEQEIKTRDTKSDVVRKLNSDPKDWRSLMNADVLKYLSTDPLKGKTFHYKPSWTDCLRLIRNVKEHWHDRPRPRPELFYSVDDPQEYFLNLFPNLPVVLHGIIRSCDWKERPDLKEYF